MKNQYFGDNRDLFKYDLVCRIMEECPVNHFTYIPMLTKGHGDEYDREKAKAGKNNECLKKFLGECISRNGRNIDHLENFFKDKVTIYKKDDDDKYFSNDFRRRKEYFDQIADELLQESLILVDPDKGMKEDKSDKEHILYSEVKTLYEHMGSSSILMIFQNFPREDQEKYLLRRSKELRKDITRDLPLHIDDGKTIFFFLTKDNKILRESLSQTISNYKQAYPELRM